MYVLWIVVCPVLSVLLWYTDSDYPFCLFKLFLCVNIQMSDTWSWEPFATYSFFLSCLHECTDSWNIAHLEYKTFSWNTFVSFNILNIVYFYRNKYCNEKGKRTTTLKKCCCSFASVACSLLLPGARYSQPRGSHLLPKEAAWVLCVQWLACCSPRMW